MAVRQEDLENTYQSYRQSAAQEDLLNLVQAGEVSAPLYQDLYRGWQKMRCSPAVKGC